MYGCIINMYMSIKTVSSYFTYFSKYKEKTEAY